MLLLLKTNSKFCKASEHKWIELSSYEFSYDLHEMYDFDVFSTMHHSIELFH